MKAASLLVLFIALGGCGIVVSRELTLDECRAGEWRDIGRSDGVQGFLKQDRLRDYEIACGPIRIAPDIKDYTRGYEKGRAEYCQPASLFYEGVYGNAYLGACNDRNDAGRLVDAYRDGLSFAKRRKQGQEARDAILARLEAGQGLSGDPERLAAIRAELDRIEEQADAIAIGYLR